MSFTATVQIRGIVLCANLPDWHVSTITITLIVKKKQLEVHSKEFVELLLWTKPPKRSHQYIIGLEFYNNYHIETRIIIDKNNIRGRIACVG